MGESATFWDKWTEVPSLSRDKVTTSKSYQGIRHASTARQNLLQDPGRDGTVLSRHAGKNGAE